MYYRYILGFVFIISTCGVFAEDDFSAYAYYKYDPNDFAVEYIEYYHNGTYRDYVNGMSMDNPEYVLGRPTVDSTGDDWFLPEQMPVPVNPVFPAFRYNELLFLGESGYITVGFGHPVRDDENNPYGIDLIVFGNAFQVIGSNQSWSNGDPATIYVGSDGFYEPGIVSVSQDGITWYSFTNDTGFMAGDPDFIILADDPNDGPFCDSFAPTLGRVYTDDPELADSSLGTWNQWWAEPTNPTLPVDPELWFDSFDGYTVAQICQVYGNSAGGTGYDISKLDLPVDPETGKKWFQYVRVDDRVTGGSAEIDAFADVSCCGDYKHPYPVGDLTRDCRVDLNDFAFLADYWFYEYMEPESQASFADIWPDDRVDLEDLLVLANEWLSCTWDCDQD